MSADFTLYAVPTGASFGLPSEHTYVGTSDGANFNCFGRWDGGRIVRPKTSGSSRWAKLIYGPAEGVIDVKPAAGLKVRFDGVCQNAANRILVLTEDAVDARGTKGNVLATLMYGKFGFNIDQYVQTVTTTGANLLQSNPGEIQPGDVPAVLGRIAQGQTPDAELDLLHVDVQEQDSVALPDITDAQRAIFGPIYSVYQNQRKAAFLATASNVPYQVGVGNPGIAPQFAQSLRGPLETCVAKLVVALGPAQFNSLFGVTPDELTGKLGGFGQS